MESSHTFITFVVALTCMFQFTFNLFVFWLAWSKYFVLFISRMGKHFIYNVLDWSHPEKSMIMVAGTLVLAITVHIILFWVYKLRKFIQRRFFGTELILPTKSGKDRNSNKSLGSQISMVFGDNDGCTNEAFKTTSSVVFK